MPKSAKLVFKGKLFDEFVGLISDDKFQDREITLKLLDEGFKIIGGEAEVSKLKNLFFD